MGFQIIHHFHRRVPTARGEEESSLLGGRCAVTSELALPARLRGTLAARAHGTRRVSSPLMAAWETEALAQGQRHFRSLKVSFDPAACQCDASEV